MPAQVCSLCKQALPAAAFSSSGKRCRVCRSQQDRDRCAKRNALRQCELCLTEYQPTWAQQRWCSKSCAKLKSAKPRSEVGFSRKIVVLIIRAPSRPKPRRWFAGYCGHCGQPFVTDQPTQYHCSRTCSNRHHRQIDKHRRRAKGAYNGIPRRNRIATRDGWRCQLCGKKVSPTRAYPHPHSASLDHILPLALGGTHEDSNLQLAHLYCNVTKGAGGTDQLRLIG